MTDGWERVAHPAPRAVYAPATRTAADGVGGAGR
jgi:hypothetical protein